MQARTALPCDAQSVRSARRFVTDSLRAEGLNGDLLDTVALLVSELVSNAVLHARSDIEVTVTPAGSGVRVGVADGSPRGVIRRRHQLEATTGRGLLLVDQLAAAWGVEPSTGGKLVWFEVQPGMAEREPDLSSFLALDGGAA